MRILSKPLTHCGELAYIACAVALAHPCSYNAPYLFNFASGSVGTLPENCQKKFREVCLKKVESVSCFVMSLLGALVAHSNVYT